MLAANFKMLASNLNLNNKEKYQTKETHQKIT